MGEYRPMDVVAKAISQTPTGYDSWLLEEVNQTHPTEYVFVFLILEPDKQEALIESLCEKLVKFREGEQPYLRLQLLSNLFHGMDKNTPVRYTVYCSLIKVAASCGAIQYIPTELDKVRKWISDWNLTTEKKHTLLRLLYEALVDSKKSDAASKVMVELLGSYTEDNASQARVDGHRCIVPALKDPNAFLFDHLLTLKPVKFLEGELIHDLLTIFVSAKLASYVKFYQNNKDFIDSLGLLHDQNMAKMRLLTFMGMAVGNKELSFDTMQQELQIGAVGQLLGPAVLLQEAQEVWVEVLLLIVIGHSCYQQAQDELGMVLEKVDLYSTIAEVQDDGTVHAEPGTQYFLNKVQLLSLMVSDLYNNIPNQFPYLDPITLQHRHFTAAKLD
ncbi:PREDICTED: eukaryotic translation initiation factor 3 subunit M-like [Elephantulus edwardii]|uniref:eukaryotic translation initiation factor 3 subunit M-like n=1 Tax=Elephantulus edwardii TaxID=28737 RepID=UPI0003F0A95F|nr:PREDICTED: eukaryotic translation initiation factor 3 subunit M-like [Elephantulus edwardii]